MAHRKRRKRRTRREHWRRRLLLWVPIIVLLGLCWPLATIVPSSSGKQSDPVRIADYVAGYEVSPNGELSATETITGEFPVGRHGIFRYWDLTDPNDPRIRHQTTIESITMDGQPEPAEMFIEGAQRYLVAKIGDPDVLVTPGRHVYQIKYRTTGALTPASTGSIPEFQSAVGDVRASAQSVFWWNVVATGWRMPIDRARLEIKLPGPALFTQCSQSTPPIGSDEASEAPCVMSPAGGQHIQITASRIPPFGGITIRSGLAMSPPPVATIPWPWQLDPILGRSAPGLLSMVIAAAMAGVLGLAWGLVTRERRPPRPLASGPPAGLGPVQTMYVGHETTGDHDVVATLFQLAVIGLMKIEMRDRSWTATATPAMGAAALTRCDPVAQSLVRALQLGEPEAQFRASASLGSGKAVTGARREMAKACRTWAREQKLTRWSLLGLAGRTVWFVAILAALACFTTRFVPTAWALIPLAFLAGGHRLVMAGSVRRRTRAGRRLWSQAGGFERMLATSSAEARFDFAARRDLFLPYLPYAMAFGVAKQWAAKYEDELNEPPPMPDWLDSTSRRVTTVALIGTVNSFETTLRSTIAGYQSPPSSSGGGGGSSVGSGGGGGGGGSW